ncbi:glycosyltransferase family 2 protein [bacterium]|jgi:glycosyltransferase involved in cell wall biosynthesis|nr:glycosyltransferase family 2 protein [bacterium]
MPLRDLYADHQTPTNDPSSRLCVVLPAYNEALTVARVIRQIRDHVDFQGQIDIIVVDDGSTDNTSEVAAEASAIVIRHRRNEGLGVAIATGLEGALQIGADIIVTMDSDGQFKGEHVTEIIAPILDDQAEMVIGSRYLRADYIPEETPFIKKLMSDSLCWLVSQVVWGKKLTDVTCGFRAYTRSAAIRLNFLTRFTYTVESVIDAASKGIVIAEVPVRCRGVREHGTSRITTRFLRYVREIFLIILRRMRDSRPMMFFLVISLAFILIGTLSVLGVWLWWPWKPSRDAAVMLTGMSISIFAIISSISLLADQVLTSSRYLHSLMRMTRISHYDIKDMKESFPFSPGFERRVVSMGVRPKKKPIAGSTLTGNGVANGTHKNGAGTIGTPITTPAPEVTEESSS